MTPRSSTETLIRALRILGRDIQSADGVANAVMFEAADRLYELSLHSDTLADALEKLHDAEDASVDEFTAKEIDAIEAAMEQATEALAAYRASQQPKP